MRSMLARFFSSLTACLFFLSLAHAQGYNCNLPPPLSGTVDVLPQTSVLAPGETTTPAQITWQVPIDSGYMKPQSVVVFLENESSPSQKVMTYSWPVSSIITVSPGQPVYVDGAPISGTLGTYLSAGNYILSIYATFEQNGTSCSNDEQLQAQETS
ncbi:MAG TPA: hypothetical protein VJP80_08610 [Candidatus Saccharimonadales bacterium]|nr:hypothetical protein [Candidatus Saccharimonadales bacterium]